MAQLNSITVIPRHNRPSTEERVELQLNYIVGGSLADPYEIESVHIFKDTTASSVEFPYITNGLIENLVDLSATSDNYGLLATSSLNSSVFRYAYTSGTPVTSSVYDTSNYSLDSSAASGIYRSDDYAEGVFSVILAPGISGTEEDDTARTIPASGLQSGDYFDVWTVRHRSTGNLRIFAHEFKLSLDSVITTTEPIIVESTVKLKNRYVEMGSKEDLHFTCNYGVTSKGLSRAEKNIFRDSLLRDVKLRLVKINEDPNLTSRFEVSGFSDTSGLMHVTAHDDVLFNFDTTVLQTIANANTDYGSILGVYEVQLEYVILTETLRSPKFRIVVR